MEISKEIDKFIEGKIYELNIKTKLNKKFKFYENYV